MQDLLQVHVLQRTAQLLQPSDHGGLGEGDAAGLPLLDGLLDAAFRGKLHHDVQVAFGLRAAAEPWRVV